MDDSQVDSYDREIHLTIKSQCPAKWAFVDMETAEIWVSGYRTPEAVAREPGYTFYKADDEAVKIVAMAALGLGMLIPEIAAATRRAVLSELRKDGK